MKNILILGATSAIAEHTARIYAKNHNNLYLVARNKSKLLNISQDLTLRGADKADCYVADLTDIQQHEVIISQAIESMGHIDIVLIAYGVLGNQQQCQQSASATLFDLNVNCISVISLLTIIANVFETQKHGTIAVISSVAGDRGRRSNYVYGTAKGALSIFLQGLRNRLSQSNINVLTIKPGFVDTPMTSDFKKGLLWVSPKTIARGIYRAIEKNKDIVYLPFFWRYIMLIIKLIPEKIFKKLSL